MSALKRRLWKSNYPPWAPDGVDELIRRGELDGYVFNDGWGWSVTAESLIRYIRAMHLDAKT